MIHKIVPITVEGGSPDSTLTLTCLEPHFELSAKKRPFILVIPGGGYEFVSHREGEPIANSFVAAGYSVGVLDYSIAPYRYPISYLEAFTALKYVHDHAEELSILTDKMFVIGFSAGGHLAGMVGTGCNDPLILEHFGVKRDYFKLCGEMLIYPVINGGEFAHRGSFDNLLGDKKNDKEWLERFSIDNRVTSETPATFLWSTFEDDCVPCENTLLMTNALRKAKVPFELHILPVGGHGLSLAGEITRDGNGGGVNPYCEKMMPLILEWLKLTIKG